MFIPQAFHGQSPEHPENGMVSDSSNVLSNRHRPGAGEALRKRLLIKARIPLGDRPLRELQNAGRRDLRTNLWIHWTNLFLLRIQTQR